MDTPLRQSAKRLGFGLAIFALLLLTGCEQEALQSNQQQLQANQQQIEQMQQQIEALKARQANPPPSPMAYAAPSGAAVPGTPGTCDQHVRDTANRRGGDAFAAGDLNRALGYFKDALTACPGNAHSEMNLARTYEALGNRTAAIDHYRAAVAASAAEPDLNQDARSSLSRLGVH
jgi:tetratricopeptide (TPR) repeat protein